MALDRETITAANTTSFQEQASAGPYVIVTLTVENESGAEVTVTCKVNGVPFVKDYSVPDGNTFIWDKKILLSDGSMISIESSGSVNVVLMGMLI